MDQARAFLGYILVLKSASERRSGSASADNRPDEVVKQGSPWHFGLEPECLASFLEPFHLRLWIDLGNADSHTNCCESVGRELVISEMERIAQTTVIDF